MYQFSLPTVHISCLAYTLIIYAHTNTHTHTRPRSVNCKQLQQHLCTTTTTNYYISKVITIANSSDNNATKEGAGNKHPPYTITPSFYYC